MHDIRPGQSVELLKRLHILTRDGRMNQDSRRKLKQVYHLCNFIEPVLTDLRQHKAALRLVDQGAGKSYLGFILYDLFFKSPEDQTEVFGIESRQVLVESSLALARQLTFSRMSFLHLPVAEAIHSPLLPAGIDLVTALHACDTATDDAIRFALLREVPALVLVPCCQAEVAAALSRRKSAALARPLTELWRHPLHTREFGSHLTNVLRCLQLEAHGYQVRVTELVGWEHSLKNELIIARRHADVPRRKAAERLNWLLESMDLDELRPRFFLPAG